MDDRRRFVDRRATARDAGLARLRRITRAGALGASALAGIFAAVAAGTTPGRKPVRQPRSAEPARVRHAHPSARTPARRQVPQRRVLSHRSVPAEPDDAAASPVPAAAAPAAPAPPPAAPAPTSAPPVAVSGGS